MNIYKSFKYVIIKTKLKEIDIYAMRLSEQILLYGHCQQKLPHSDCNVCIQMCHTCTAIT